MKSKQSLFILSHYFFLFLLSYSLFYYAYKFHTPDLGNNDEYHYFKMVNDPVNFDIAKSPFVFRQLTTGIASVIYHMGIYYETKISFSDSRVDQRIYFSLLLSNYLGLLLTLMAISITIRKSIGKEPFVYTLAAILLFLVSWGTLFFGFSALTEAWTYFFVSLLFYAFRNLNLRLFVFFIFLSIIQKEIISIIFSIFLFFIILYNHFKGFKSNQKLYLLMFLCSLLSFVFYFVLTNFFIPVKNFQNQLDINKIYTRVNTFRFSADNFFQTILINSPLWVFLWSFLQRKSTNNQIKFGTAEVSAILGTHVVLLIIGILTGILQNNNIGRITLVFAPVWAVLTIELFYRSEMSNNAKHSISGS